ncbi:hypothetical protein [Kibdelosporangium phytohabitans]|uniref:Uncharacterized protein n=1 Tax=Kibdelosporangium phytohabitans TaxID=860235 RepID=A0A0N9I2C3_9PSEU|nr:hypothetical protein [Kibdelosporangium phytohabitans]ALG14120.1 hypothetical protein AOZ06_51125 [Kibdelosporangium phytohabitans]MBE1466897.1 pimeloyl-ACP methyl ester carboxylesterase [Kibdelosporangium phytohabitans]
MRSSAACAHAAERPSSGSPWPPSIIGFDPRGVGRSTPLECELSPSIGSFPSRPTDDQFAAFTAQARNDEAACERAGGGLRPYINTPNTARDMGSVS